MKIKLSYSVSTSVMQDMPKFELAAPSGNPTIDSIGKFTILVIQWSSIRRVEGQFGSN